MVSALFLYVVYKFGQNPPGYTGRGGARVPDQQYYTSRIFIF